MVNEGSHFADFVRFRPHAYNLHAHSTISAAFMGDNERYPTTDVFSKTNPYYTVRDERFKEDIKLLLLNAPL